MHLGLFALSGSSVYVLSLTFSAADAVSQLHTDKANLF